MGEFSCAFPEDMKFEMSCTFPEQGCTGSYNIILHAWEGWYVRDIS